MKRIIATLGVIATLLVSAIGMSSAEAAYPAADGVRVASQQCLADGSVTANIAWNSFGQGQQYVEVSPYNSSFAAGAFRSVGPLAASQTSTVVAGLQSSTNYYVRVNTLTPAGWLPSAVTSFNSGDCRAFNSISYPVYNAVFGQPFYNYYAVYNALINYNALVVQPYAGAPVAPLGYRYVQTAYPPYGYRWTLVPF